ncbi:hypothetical protein B0H12DRAFT_1257700 [Mycena haematopus]|nr:hypothetical protein B0H12DRAFT_1257700 [Mycena haematopus]
MLTPGAGGEYVDDEGIFGNDVEGDWTICHLAFAAEWERCRRRERLGVLAHHGQHVRDAEQRDERERVRGAARASVAWDPAAESESASVCACAADDAAAAALYVWGFAARGRSSHSGATVTAMATVTVTVTVTISSSAMPPFRAAASSRPRRWRCWWRRRRPPARGGGGQRGGGGGGCAAREREPDWARVHGVGEGEGQGGGTRTGGVGGRRRDARGSRAFRGCAIGIRLARGGRRGGREERRGRCCSTLVLADAFAFNSVSQRPTSPAARAPDTESRKAPPAWAGAGAARPISGTSAMSSDGTGGTNGSGKSAGTVYEDAKETLSTRGSRADSRMGGQAQGEDAPPMPQGPGQDPLDAPAPRHSRRLRAPRRCIQQHSRDGSTSAQTAGSATASATLGGSASNTTLATPATGHAPLKPERVYGPPGLGAFDAQSLNFAAHGLTSPNPAANPTVNAFAPPHALTNAFAPPPMPGKGSKGSVGSWDKAGLELGFSRAASHSLLGTFGSANAVPVDTHRWVAVWRRRGWRGVWESAERSGSAPHLSLDLDDAPPGAEGRWRLLGGSAHSLMLGSSSSLAASQEWGEGAGRRGTFGLSPAAQYHHSPGHSSEHDSGHSRVGNSSVNSSSLSSASSHAHGPRLPTAHSLYPSSGSGNSARARILAHAGSVEGPMSPTLSAFGHLARDRDGEHSGSSGSSGRRQENSSGSGSGSGADRARSPLVRAGSPGSPVSPLLSPWAGGLGPDWHPT